MISVIKWVAIYITVFVLLGAIVLGIAAIAMWVAGTGIDPGIITSFFGLLFLSTLVTALLWLRYG